MYGKGTPSPNQCNHCPEHEKVGEMIENISRLIKMGDEFISRLPSLEPSTPSSSPQPLTAATKVCSSTRENNMLDLVFSNFPKVAESDVLDPFHGSYHQVVSLQLRILFVFFLLFPLHCPLPKKQFSKANLSAIEYQIALKGGT